MDSSPGNIGARLTASGAGDEVDLAGSRNAGPDVPQMLPLVW